MEIMMELMQERMREMQRDRKDEQKIYEKRIEELERKYEEMEERTETMRIQHAAEMKIMERKYEDLEKKCPSALIQSEMKFENGRLWRECERISSVYDNCFIKLATKNTNASSRLAATPEFVKISITEINLLCAAYANIDLSQLKSFYKLNTFEIDFNIDDQLSLGAYSISPCHGSVKQISNYFGAAENNSVKKFVCRNYHLPMIVDSLARPPRFTRGNYDVSAFPSFPNLDELHLYNVIQYGAGEFLTWLKTKCPVLSKIYIYTTMPCNPPDLERYCQEKGITLKIE
jgi:hypothetical protein